MKKIITISFICLACLTLAGCGTVKLNNGDNAVVSFKENDGISVNDFYELLKDKYGSDEIVSMIDEYLLSKEYSTTTEEKDYIDEVVKTMETEAQKNETEFEDYIKSYYGISTKKDFEDYISLNYRRMQWTKDYLITTVSDKQIEEYYETKTIGDIEAKHILITADTTDEMTDEEKEKAEEKALKTAKDIIKKLDDGNDFSELAKEYSDDTATAEKGGDLGSFNRGVMDENFEAAAIDLEVNSYSKTPVKSAYGYHIIYKVSQKDKPSLDEVKESIKKTISEEMLQSDSTLYASSLIELRKKYEMNIEDAELQSYYLKLINGE